MKKLESKDLMSLNSEFSEFKLGQLEQRLETDPLAVGGLLDLDVESDLSLASQCNGALQYIHCSGEACNINH